MKFRKKPVVIEAEQMHLPGHLPFESQARYRINPMTGWTQVYDRLHESWVNVADGDWVICGVKGEFYPIKDEIFRETYEAVAA